MVFALFFLLRDSASQGLTVFLFFFFFKKEPKVTKKVLIHKEKSRFQFFARAHRDFEIFKNVVLDFCDVQSLAEAKRLRKV